MIPRHVCPYSLSHPQCRSDRDIPLPCEEASTILGAQVVAKAIKVAVAATGRLPGLYTHKGGAMEDKLHQITVWASHGTPHQFFNELQAALSTHNIAVEQEGDTITCVRVRKKGGFLGIGAKIVTEPVLKLIFKDDQLEIPAESADPEVIDLLVEVLQQH
jgi:hypothetical protein